MILSLFHVSYYLDLVKQNPKDDKKITKFLTIKFSFVSALFEDVFQDFSFLRRVLSMLLHILCQFLSLSSPKQS